MKTKMQIPINQRTTLIISCLATALLWLMVQMINDAVAGDRHPIAAAEGQAGIGAGRHVTGSYLFILTAEGAPPLRGIATFHADGTFVETDEGDSPFLQTTQSPGHGAWERIGPREIAFILLELSFDEQGVLESFFKSHGVLHFDRDFEMLVGTVRLEIFAADQDPLDPSSVPISVTQTGVEAWRISVGQ
jgi:hypothetical protein